MRIEEREGSLANSYFQLKFRSVMMRSPLHRHPQITTGCPQARTYIMFPPKIQIATAAGPSLQTDSIQSAICNARKISLCHTRLCVVRAPSRCLCVCVFPNGVCAVHLVCISRQGLESETSGAQEWRPRFDLASQASPGEGYQSRDLALRSYSSVLARLNSN